MSLDQMFEVRENQNQTRPVHEARAARWKLCLQGSGWDTNDLGRERTRWPTVRPVLLAANLALTHQLNALEHIRASDLANKLSIFYDGNSTQRVLEEDVRDPKYAHVGRDGEAIAGHITTHEDVGIAVIVGVERVRRNHLHAVEFGKNAKQHAIGGSDGTTSDIVLDQDWDRRENAHFWIYDNSR